MESSERALPAQIGRYRIERLLGRGAMGRVLLAHDPVLDRSVAIKLLRDDLNIPPEQHEALLHRMRQEARASARVSHPNIVSLHDMGEDPELGLCLVFEYAEGLTLKERLLRSPLGPEAAAKLAREVGDALTTAHAAGVLHRDIKPENIILTPTGAKVADFGIARVPDSTLTKDGGLLGTPAYSAPECIASGKFSPLSDQFRSPPRCTRQSVGSAHSRVKMRSRLPRASPPMSRRPSRRTQASIRTWTACCRAVCRRFQVHASRTPARSAKRSRKRSGKARACNCRRFRTCAIEAADLRRKKVAPRAWCSAARQSVPCSVSPGFS